MELNPDHKVTKAAHDHWHKILALVMTKYNIDAAEFTNDEIQKLLGHNERAVVLQEKKDRIVVRCMSMKEAETLLAGEEMKKILREANQ
jgi:hypothetical protein